MRGFCPLITARYTMRYLTNIIKTILGIAVVVLCVVAITKNPYKAESSVSQSGEYHGTTTSTGRFPTLVVLQSTSGTLGSVVITGAAAGVINIYDATTTSATQRSADQATSSILAATLPASAAANTYTFDRIMKRGIIVEIVGTMPTSTITYR